MTTTLTRVARQTAPPGRSVIAARIFADLMALEPSTRRGLIAGLPPTDLRQVLTITEQETGTPYGLYRDDPLGFTGAVLGETTWSKTRQIMNAVPRNKWVAVPSCFGSSKTWGAARLVLWHAFTRAPGTGKAVTIAPRWRQVYRQMWPEIRTAHSKAGLPGSVDMAQMKLVTKAGLQVVVAYGLAANPYDEDAVQGIHAPSVLLVVDEAGGIGHTIGRNLRALLTGDDARAVAIGNPPTDDEGSWFEGLCDSDQAEVIRIPAAQTPNLSGEKVARCRSCPDEVPVHSPAKHMVDREWVRDAIADHGEDAPYVIAKVFARFPRGGTARALPSSWLETATDMEDPAPDGIEWVRLSDLGLRDETEQTVLRRHSWVRLGVDVAADGGDEFAIARSVGDFGSMVHHKAGAANSNAVDVAGVVLQHINRAQALAQALDSPYPVRVKIDGIGVGWGVASVLSRWASEGLHKAEIVVVIVSEGTGRQPDPAATFRPAKKRDEMWLAMRDLLQPDPATGEGSLRLRLDRRTLAQLGAPSYTTSSTGNTVIESKKSLRQRGLSSPDRGEAMLLTWYEPRTKSKRTLLT